MRLLGLAGNLQDTLSDFYYKNILLKRSGAEPLPLYLTTVILLVCTT